MGYGWVVVMVMVMVRAERMVIVAEAHIRYGSIARSIFSEILKY
jgi:hypothetical protein